MNINVFSLSSNALTAVDMSNANLTSDVASADLGQWLSGTEHFENLSDYFENLSSWVSEKLALKHKNASLQPIIYIISNYALLETAQHVFNIGFIKLDMTGFTLKQIQETVQRIEAKVDTMLKEPLNSAIDFFTCAMLEIENESFKDAYENFKDVIGKATEALQYSSGEKIDFDCFTEFVKAIQLIAFSRISRYSYDEIRNCFLPYPALPIQKINLIGKVLEELTKKTLAQKDNVKISFFERNDQKRKIQDTLDKILKICYSYISQAKEWTNMRNKIKQKDLKYTITVMPQYLPEGFEDAAKVIVGIKTGEDQPCTVLLWRTAEYVYSALGNDIVAMEKISSETEPLNIDIMNNNGSIAVISCQGYAARHVGFCLGQYYLWDAHKTIYKQRITKKNQTPAFIYYYSGTILPSGWQVGPSPDNSKCWMFNGSSIDTAPMLGWKYWNGNEWKSDEWKSLALKIGPTLVHCENTTLSSKGSDNTAEMKPQYYTGVSQTAADRRSLYCRKRQSSIF